MKNLIKTQGDYIGGMIFFGVPVLAAFILPHTWQGPVLFIDTLFLLYFIALSSSKL